jgi:mono/diheme cytochrome c family protein
MLCAPDTTEIDCAVPQKAGNSCARATSGAQEKCCKPSCEKDSMSSCCKAGQASDSGKQQAAAVLPEVSGGVSITKPATPSTDSETARLLSLGKPMFVERCGACHNERGDKPLADGPPLNERKLTLDRIERAARGRLKGRTEEEQRAVALYIESFLKN